MTAAGTQNYFFKDLWVRPAVLNGLGLLCSSWQYVHFYVVLLFYGLSLYFLDSIAVSLFTNNETAMLSIYITQTNEHARFLLTGVT